MFGWPNSECFRLIRTAHKETISFRVTLAIVRLGEQVLYAKHMHIHVHEDYTYVHLCLVSAPMKLSYDRGVPVKHSPKSPYTVM